MGNNTQIFENDTNIGGPSNTHLEASTGGASVSIVPGSSPSNDKFFVPDPLTVSVGTAVTWTNDDSTLHTVTSGSPEGGVVPGTQFDSSYLAAGKTFIHSFESAGTFDYYCTLHPHMTGRIIVN